MPKLKPHRAASMAVDLLPLNYDQITMFFPGNFQNQNQNLGTY